MQYLPLFVKLTDKPVLIVGGGSVALRKAGTLLSAGAKLTVVAPDFAAEYLESDVWIVQPFETRDFY